MKTVTISEQISYVRYIPQIYGRENLFDSEALLKNENTRLIQFIGSVFDSDIMIGEDDRIQIDSTTPDLVRALTDDNDEITIGSRGSRAIGRRFDGEQIIIPLIRPGYRIYGHWLLDLLPKVNFFKQHHPALKFKILIHEATPDWAIDIIETLHVGEIVKLRPGEWATGRFFLMSPVRHHDYISDTVHANSVIPVPNKKGTDKFYLSREKVGVQYRSFHNSQDIERLFETHGFNILYPEQHTISEQIKLFSNASVLAGEGGSALHNSVFCAADTTIINLQSGRQNHFIQSGLCYRYGQSPVYVFGPSDTDDWGSGFSIPEQYCKQILSGLSD